MKWKKLPYWLRGGTVTILVYFVISIISLIEFQINYRNSDMGTIGYGIIIASGFIILIIFGFESYERLATFANDIILTRHELSPLILFIIINSVIYFVFGALIGFLIEKIKPRNKK